MKSKLMSVAIAASIALSAAVSANAGIRIGEVNTNNVEVIEAGYHGYKKAYKPRAHSHKHCHRKWSYGKWIKTCHYHKHWKTHH